MVTKYVKKSVKPLYKYIQYWLYRSFLNKNHVLHHKYLGKRIFILGDGASLNDINLRYLHDEYTMGCNYIMVHKDFAQLNLDFYALASSHRSLTRLNDPGRQPPPTGNFEKALYLLSENTIGTHTQFFFDVSVKKMIEKRFFPNHEIFYMMSGNDLRAGEPIQLDLTQPLSMMASSLYFMIALALSMGFTEIYLCGCGYTYSPRQVGHFYDDWTNKEETEVDYKNWILKEAAQQNNAIIYNVVPDGFQSPVYQPVHVSKLEEILARKGAQKRY